jgi:16S rRNA (adenine1518-N6/adenine1519-N6)-dimethyltransferase
MDLLQKTLDTCKKYDIKPARSRGQNFLITEEVYEKIIEVADLKKDDVVLEVGPGLGFLTEKLAKKVKNVIAVELDDKLAGMLRIFLLNKDVGNVEIVNKNILDFNFQFPISNFQKISNFQIPKTEENRKLNTKYIIPNTKYKIVANLPYNITSIFLRKFLTSENKPESMVLMLQKEVAERIAAKPGEMSVLAISVQFYAQPEIVSYVPKQDFWPQPEVDSAIIKINILKGSKSIVKELSSFALGEDNFFKLVKIGFSAKRKMLRNNLANGFHISTEKTGEIIKKAGFSEKIRAQELGVGDWVKLLAVFDKIF